jgi:hypothetical protein
MLAILAVSVAALIAMSAFVIDVGSWWRTHRATQAVADAAALAGAQELPGAPGQAMQVALDYSNKNGGNISASEITFESNTFTNDTIRVKARRTSPGFLSRILGISSVDVSADAAARAFNVGQAQYVAPFGVWCGHDYLLSCNGGNAGKFGPSWTTTIELDTANPSVGAFKIINIDGSDGGLGQQTMNDWILNGMSQPMNKDTWYYSNPGAKFNPRLIRDAMETVKNSLDPVFYIPVYSEVRLQGANYQYFVIGWVSFHLTDFRVQGDNAFLEGYFVEYTQNGIITESGDDFMGSKIIKLVG